MDQNVLNTEQYVNCIREIFTTCNEELISFEKTLDDLIGCAQTSGKLGHSRTLLKNVQSNAQVRSNNASKVLHSHEDNFTQKKASVVKLDEELQTLKDKCILQSEDIEKHKKQEEAFTRKLKALQFLRDTIRAYKLLTGIHFSYKEGGTRGYVKRSNSSTVEGFAWDDHKHADGEITKKLWTLVEKVSTEKQL